MFRRTYYVQRAERRSAAFEGRHASPDRSFSSFMGVLLAFLLVCMCIVFVANWQLLFVAEVEIENLSRHCSGHCPSGNEEQNSSRSEAEDEYIDREVLATNRQVQNLSEDSSWTRGSSEASSAEPSMGSSTQAFSISSFERTEFIEPELVPFETTSETSSTDYPTLAFVTHQTTEDGNMLESTTLGALTMPSFWDFFTTESQSRPAFDYNDHKDTTEISPNTPEHSSIGTSIRLGDILNLTTIATKYSSTLFHEEASTEPWSHGEVEIDHRTITPAMAEKMPLSMNSNEWYKMFDPNQ